MLKFFLYKNNKPSWKLIFDTMKQHLSELLQTQDVCIELKKISKQPTDSQRGYYWAVILPMIKHGLYELGNDQYKQIEDVHDFMKEQLKFYTIETIKIKKTMLRVKKYKSISNAEGAKDETSKYIDECIRWAAENLSVIIPEANRYGYK